MCILKQKEREITNVCNWISDSSDCHHRPADGADYEVYYTKDDGETNLGTTAPTEPGVYAINVLVKENNIYKSSSAFRWYRINENEAQSLKKVLPQ